MPSEFYEEMDKLFKELRIEVEDTDEKQRIIDAENFVATFTPDKEVVTIV